MKANFLSLKKRILKTQLLSLIFAFMAVIYTRVVLANDWMMGNLSVFYIGITMSIVIVTVVVRYFLDGKWMNVVLITIPYLMYWFMLFVVSSIINPAHVDDDNYGAGIVILLTNFYLWGSVIVGSVIGTYLKRKF